jgi:hypothetical protein
VVRFGAALVPHAVGGLCADPLRLIGVPELAGEEELIARARPRPPQIEELRDAADRDRNERCEGGRP